MMAAAPAATAVILTAIMFALVPRVSIGGTAYDQLMWGKRFQVSTSAPSLYIVEIHNEVQQLVIAAQAGEPYDSLQSDISRRRAQYERDYDSWVSRLTDVKTRNDLTASHEAANRYFQLYQSKLLPAVRDHHDVEAASLLRTQMARALSDHRGAAMSAAQRVQDQVTQQEREVASQTHRQTLGIIAVTLLMIAGSTALGLTVLKSITDRVQRLNEVATVELPQVLDEVKRATLAGEEIPSLPAPRGEGTDELAAVAVAFNSVVATAVGLAAEQSRMRGATAQMFINLGRRNHKLLSRTLTYITQLESDERDPSTLQNLFRLDHLTTRMRRHAESLLVLAGSPALRTWSRPVPVADVLRAALSEIETYDRVDIKELEPVEVRGASVSDLAHLLAELLENATAFSPPQTRVRVLGRVDSDGYTVVVVDEGIGMSPAELDSANELINTPDDSLFLGDSRMLGLGVVGRLASRHGFKVNLTASPVGGVVAWVTLPTSALAPRRGVAEPDLGAGPAPAGSGLASGSLLGTSDGLPRQQAGTDLGQSSTSTTPAALPSRPVAPSSPAAGAAASSEREAAGARTREGAAPRALPQRRPAEPLPGRSTGSSRADDRSPATPRPAEVDPAIAAAIAAESPAPSGPGPVTATPSPATSSPSPTGSGASSTPGGTPPVIIDLTAVEQASSRSATRQAPAASAPAGGSTIVPPRPGTTPVGGPIAFRKPPTGPGETGTLTRRVRGAQLPDTGEAAPSAPDAAARPQRSAQSVRGALQSFNTGRRTASEITLGGSQPTMAPVPPATSTPASTSTSTSPAATAEPHTSSPAPEAPVAAPRTGRRAAPAPEAPAGASPEPVVVESGQQLPRRVRGAQMPETDLPVSAPPPERSAAEVRAALSNFVAGRRAAEHDED